MTRATRSATKGKRQIEDGETPQPTPQAKRARAFVEELSSPQELVTATMDVSESGPIDQEIDERKSGQQAGHYSSFMDSVPIELRNPIYRHAISEYMGCVKIGRFHNKYSDKAQWYERSRLPLTCKQIRSEVLKLLNEEPVSVVKAELDLADNGLGEDPAVLRAWPLAKKTLGIPVIVITPTNLVDCKVAALAVIPSLVRTYEFKDSQVHGPTLRFDVSSLGLKLSIGNAVHYTMQVNGIKRGLESLRGHS